MCKRAYGKLVNKDVNKLKIKSNKLPGKVAENHVCIISFKGIKEILPKKKRKPHSLLQEIFKKVTWGKRDMVKNKIKRLPVIRQF